MRQALKMNDLKILMSIFREEVEMSKPIEWWIKRTTVNPYDYAFRVKPLTEELQDATHVIEKSAYDELELKLLLSKPLFSRRQLEAKLKVAIEALKSICDNRCAHQNPCEAKEALEKITAHEAVSECKHEIIRTLDTNPSASFCEACGKRIDEQA
jgi:hypothetical protein